MALLDHREDSRYNDDYRAYLVSRNQAPIVHDCEGHHFKWLSALGRSAFGVVSGWGRTLYAAIRSSKYRRLQREFMWHGIPYSYLLEDDSQAKSTDAAHGVSRNLP